MSIDIGVEQLNKLKVEFQTYLSEKNPNWNDKQISTIVSEAFFALNYQVGIDFWSSLISEESLLTTRDKIYRFLSSTQEVDNVEEQTSKYFSSLRQLKTFLDEKHPHLPVEWSNKAISTINLQSEFKGWMKKQKKPNGESYSSNTINVYVNALKNATAKLGLSDAVYANLFSYTLADEFEAAYKLIVATPNFGEIDAQAGNKAYSNSMAFYARFLKELGEPSVWIFQGNPKFYDVVGAVEALNTLTWGVNQYQKQIKNGDKVYIWVSGSDAGIIASGTIITDPKMHEPDSNDPYSKHTDPVDTTPYLAVDIQLERKFTQKKVPRVVLLADERTKQLGILTYPGATNFRVTKAQEEVIETIIDGSYKQVDKPKEEAVIKRRYWIYSPGEQAKLWDEFSEKGLMGIRWDELGNLTQFASKEELKTAMQQTQGSTKSYKNSIHALWQFTNDMEIGDIVFVKKGSHTILGRGVVESGYIFDAERGEVKNIRKVNWTHKGEWEHPGKAVQKTLTEITPYTNYIEKLETLFVDELKPTEMDDEPEIYYPSYLEADFLSEVYLSAEKYEKLKGLLLRKKNIILQGAPGVGKTFAAQRLAFSIMGEKDISRVKMIQFHQSYSYEDFIMGYRPRPDGNGFSLEEGPFYKFCKMAEEDDERGYFFIIDEINRGNLSKVFGELLMLIEGDKRGEKNALRLLYKNEQFSVPANVYIIGMMNTADRSLALIDYALRRRFAFFNMEPAFQSAGFKEQQAKIQNPKFDKLITAVETLNKEIGQDPALGQGFCIGHSYFCTNDAVDEAWLSSVVEYELLPLLSEYWFDEPSKVESWSARLRSAVNG